MCVLQALARISNILLIFTGLLALNPPIYFLNKSLGWRNTLRIASAVVIATGVGAVSTFSKPSQRNTEQEMKYTKTEAVLSTEEKETVYSDEINGNESIDSKLTKEQKIGVSSDLLSKKMKEDESMGVGEEFRALAVLKYPELWLLAVAMVVCSAAVCFFYMSLVRHICLTCKRSC